MIKATYDPDSDAGYLYLDREVCEAVPEAPCPAPVRTLEMLADYRVIVNFDIGRNNQLVGIEVIGVREMLKIFAER